MKSLAAFFATVALAFTLGCQTPPGADAYSDRVSVNYENPERFTDLKEDLHGTGKSSERMQDLFRAMVREEAGPRLKDGQKLTITFTDVDLAGDYLPSASSGYDIRVVKEIYPPRQRFNYRLTDASGAVVKEGSEAISDTNFSWNINPVNRHDELFHDRELFRDWVRKTL